jgi:hypothetical protein
MCTDCGCLAVPVIEALREDHLAIAARVRRISEALDERRLLAAAHFTAELADMFAHHVSIEQAGLFAQLSEAGDTTRELDRLIEAQTELSAELSDARVVEDAPRLRRLLGDVLRVGELEDIELYPYALQRLPVARWGLIEEVHQLLLTG